VILEKINWVFLRSLTNTNSGVFSAELRGVGMNGGVTTFNANANITPLTGFPSVRASETDIVLEAPVRRYEINTTRTSGTGAIDFSVVADFRAYRPTTPEPEPEPDPFSP
jgi:hypothetical protein